MPPLVVVDLDWDLQDPAGPQLDEVRAIRHEIARRMNDLVMNHLVLELDQ